MDVRRKGSVNVSVDFAVKNVYDITEFRGTYTRKDYGGAASAYSTPVSFAITALTALSDAHTDNKGIYFSSVVTDGSQYQVRVDFPDEAFATGADEVLCVIYDDADEEISHRIISLVGEVQDLYGGKVWIDTVNGNPGTVPGENGTVDRPVLGIEDALDLAFQLGIAEISVVPFSLIVLSDTVSSKRFTGKDYIIDLSDEEVNSVVIEGGAVIGTATSTGNDLVIRDGFLAGDDSNTVGLPGGTFVDNCRINGSVSLNEASERYVFRNCSSMRNGTISPVIFDFVADACELICTGYEGAMQLKDFNDGVGDKAYITGKGTFSEGANCTSGTPFVIGVWQMEGLDFLTPDRHADSKYTVSTFVDSAKNSIDGIKEKTDTLPHSVKKNVDIDNFYFVMLDATTGAPVSGLTVAASRKLDSDAAWTNMAETIHDVGFGVYRMDIVAAHTNGNSGVWRFVASGAQDIAITFLTEA